MIRRGMLIFLALSLWAISGVFGQTQKPLTNTDILNMTKQGFDLKFVAELSSKTAIEGDPVEFLLDDDSKVGESIVISKGAHAVATVSSAKKAGMMGNLESSESRCNTWWLAAITCAARYKGPRG